MSNPGQLRSNPSNRVRIRPFTGAMNETYVSSIWALLKSAIQEIQKKNNSGLSFEELYRNAYTMVLHKHGEMLYTGLRDVVADHLSTKVREDVVKSLEKGSDFLSSLKASWNDHTVAMVMIRDILMYMDRVYVQQIQGLECVYNLGLLLFRDKVVRTPPIRENIRSALISCITRDRNGEKIDRLTVKSICEMLIAVGVHGNSVYEEDFETPFLQTSAEFYQEKAGQLLETKDASFYLEQSEQMLEAEDERAVQMLHPSTRSRLLRVVEAELLSKHIGDVLDLPNSGIQQMLQFRKFTDVARAYRLFKRVDEGPEGLADRIRSNLINQGRALFTDSRWTEEGTDKTKKSIEIVEGLIKLRNDYDDLLVNAFHGDNLFKLKICSAFESILNIDHIGPECLSIFFDQLLKRGSKSHSEVDTEQLIDGVMILFRYLQEKDAFERYYKHYLSRRLLTNRSVGEQHERMVLARLKTECGSHYASKMEGMFKDIFMSTAINEEFRQKAEPLPIEFSCRVLATGNWPQLPQDVSLNIPSEAVAAFDHFKQFYLSKHNGRRLKLVHYYGNFELFFRPRGDNNTTHILLANPYQAVVLYAFNDANEYSVEALSKHVGIEPEECKLCLKSLTMPAGGNQIVKQQGGLYSINDRFFSRQLRIKLNQMRKTSGCPTEKQNRELQQRILDDRKHEIDACIVRSMKARKTLRHNQLVQQVTEQLKGRFMPDPAVIKTRIENLIERDFLRRDKDDRKVYVYVA